jgi:hypothetical protein
MVKNILGKIVNRLRNPHRADTKLIKQENEQADIFTRDSIFYETIVSALKKVISKGGKFGKWALSESALRYFCYYLLKNNSNIKLIELGGGQSTFFWNNLTESDTMKKQNCFIEVETFEHNQAWADKLKKLTSHPRIRSFNLKQFTEDEYNLIIENPEILFAKWDLTGKIVPKSEDNHTRIKNTFYDISLNELPGDNSLDGLIVDGPHGNGRSLVFPLFYKALKINSIILIDDFDHYPFLEDLEKLFKIKVLQKCQTIVKKWILVQITDKKFNFSGDNKL